MTIALASAFIRHERRVRLSFTLGLGAGAFTSLSPYSVANLDGLGASPLVTAVIALSSSPNVVELQLANDLTPGASYSFSAVGVPGIDASVTPNPSTAVATFGQPTVTAPSPGSGSTTAAVVYGRDLRWGNGDFVEDHTGDLASVAGTENVNGALDRRARAAGLPWDPAYGPRIREYVDGAPGSLYTLRGKCVAQMLKDDRVADCTATIDLSDPTAPFISISPVLIGASGAAAQRIFVAATSGGGS